MMTVRSLRRIVSLQAVGTVFIPFVIMLLLLAVWMLPQLKAGVNDRQLQLASAVAAQVDSYLSSSFTEITAVATAPPGSGSGQQAFNNLLDSHVAASISLNAIYLVNAQGRIEAAGLSKRQQHTARRQRDIITRDFSGNPLFIDVVRSQGRKWSSTFYSLVSGGPAVGLGVPAGTKVVIGELDLERLMAYLQRISLGEEQLVLLLDRSGQIIVDPRGRYATQKLTLSTIPFVRESLRTSGTASGQFQFAGTTMIGTIAHAQTTDWEILIAQPVKLAYRPVWTNMRIVAVSLLIAVLFGIYGSLNLSRRLADRFSQLTQHACRLARGKKLPAWPQFNIAEFRQLSADLQQMAEALQSSESRFRAVTETAPDAIISADTAGRIIFYNQAAVAIFGYTEAEVSGQSVEMLMPERFHDALRQGLARWQLTGSSHSSGQISTLFALRKGGGEFPVEFSLASCLDSKGLFFTAIIRDISERRRLEEKLQQSLKMESIGRLAGGVAHDFNNKLAVILGYAELSKMHVPEGGKLWQYQQEIAQAAGHSRDITAQLLSFSRQQVVNPKPLNLSRVIEDLQNTLPRIIGEDISLKFNLARNLLVVNMDASQLDQIIMNLAVNARDAMPDGGELTITTANAAIYENSSRRHLDAKPGIYVQLLCSDTGCGMDKETLKHIFEPFFTTKEVGKGTGLGLATIYGIVTQSEGFIEVASEPGQGTTFKIYLPGTEGAESAAADENHAVVKGSGRVLLVEDEPTVRAMVTSMLELLGYGVIAAATPKEAVTLSADDSVQFDMVMTDVVMPGMNGRAMIEEIKKVRSTVRVLFMSGYTENIISGKGLEPRTVHFLHKPFDVQRLSDKVNEVMATPLAGSHYEKHTAH